MLSEKARICRVERKGPVQEGPFFMQNIQSSIMKNLNLSEFLKIKDQFQLGNLTTEGFNLKSKNLSKIKNTIQAISVCKDIDVDALKTLKNKKQEVFNLKESIARTLSLNNRVFICGCGATGRLALSLEFLFREKFKTNQVVSFMAGGDYALIKSVEQFEDRLDFGKRQLLDLGFTDQDLLISITEGGETSFVIGASLAASEISQHESFFIYCNPDEELQSIERSKKILDKENIKKINLNVGAMTISGSTRMQATTVQMFVAGIALLNFDLDSDFFFKEYDESLKTLIDLDYSFLESFIEKESEFYKEDGIITYSVHEDLAICALTDTTERSPTFSLRAFEQVRDTNYSLCFLTVLNTSSTDEAWRKILKRSPRCLAWRDIDEGLSVSDLYKFDVSERSIQRRADLSNKHSIFEINFSDDEISFHFLEESTYIPRHSSLLINHLILKVLLNTHSTLVMIKLNRVHSNVMSYVRPSNLKLIDRATRYVKELSDDSLSYEQALERVIENISRTQENESIVLKCLKL